MPKATRQEIEESFDREGMLLDEEDEALLRHVLLEDEGPPQGLHQGGRKAIERAQKDDYLQEFQRRGSE